MLVHRATRSFRGLDLTPATLACLAWETGYSRDVPKVFERHLGPPCRSRSGLLQGGLDQSRANASIGSSRAALRAGTKPKTIPISVEQMKAVTIEFTENTIFHSFTSSENT